MNFGPLVRLPIPILSYLANYRSLTCYGQYYDPLAMINNIPTLYADYADQVQVPDSKVCAQPKPSPTHCLTGWQEHQDCTQGSCTQTSW